MQGGTMKGGRAVVVRQSVMREHANTELPASASGCRRYSLTGVATIRQVPHRTRRARLHARMRIKCDHAALSTLIEACRPRSCARAPQVERRELRQVLQHSDQRRAIKARAEPARATEGGAAEAVCRLRVPTETVRESHTIRRSRTADASSLASSLRTARPSPAAPSRARTRH